MQCKPRSRLPSPAENTAVRSRTCRVEFSTAAAHELTNHRWRELIRLTTILERHRGYRHSHAERPSGADGTLPPGFVSIEHEHHAIEVACQEVRLMLRQRRAHEAHHWIPWWIAIVSKKPSTTITVLLGDFRGDVWMMGLEPEPHKAAANSG
jgi:hypothetical protein